MQGRKLLLSEHALLVQHLQTQSFHFSSFLYSAHDIAQDYCEHGIGTSVRPFEASE